MKKKRTHYKWTLEDEKFILDNRLLTPEQLKESAQFNTVIEMTAERLESKKKRLLDAEKYPYPGVWSNEHLTALKNDYNIHTKKFKLSMGEYQKKFNRQYADIADMMTSIRCGRTTDRTGKHRTKPASRETYYAGTSSAISNEIRTLSILVSTLTSLDKAIANIRNKETRAIAEKMLHKMLGSLTLTKEYDNIMKLVEADKIISSMSA